MLRGYTQIDSEKGDSARGTAKLLALFSAIGSSFKTLPGVAIAEPIVQAAAIIPCTAEEVTPLLSTKPQYYGTCKLK